MPKYIIYFEPIEIEAENPLEARSKWERVTDDTPYQTPDIRKIILAKHILDYNDA